MGSETLVLPEEGLWHVVVDENTAGLKPIFSFTGKEVTAAARSAMVLYIE
jgi:hypothetical protein